MYNLLSNGFYIQNAEANTENVIYSVLKKQRNVLVLGPGGCGKTYTINKLIKMCETLNKKYAITSSTGISAINFENGKTLHSYSGLGLAKMSKEDIQNSYNNNNRMGINWSKIDLLIIDEISMVGANFFEKVELCARLSRRDDRPFGGLQLVCSGDFLQLPPVMDSFIFCSDVWRNISFRVHLFEKSVRQSEDHLFFELLQRIRKGVPNSNDIKMLMSRKMRTCEAGHDIEYKKDDMGFYHPKLYPQNKSVEEENMAMLDKEPGYIKHTNLALDNLVRLVKINNVVNYQPYNGPLSVQYALNKINKGFRVKHPDELHLKVGCQYFLTYNKDTKNKLVNGSLCIYMGNYMGNHTFMFRDGKKYIINRPVCVRIKVEDDIYLERWQFPLKLGYAITIHSSQGMTLETAIIDLGKDIFAGGQTYVALSRLRTLDGVYLLDFDESKIRANQKAIEYYNKIK